MQLIALNDANRKIFQFVTHHCGAAICRNKQQAHDRIAVNSSHALCAADRAAFDKALDYQRSDFRSAGDRVPRQFVVRFAESGIAGSTAPALDAPLTEVAELFAGLVLAANASHGVSPLDFLAEKRHNEFGSGSWLTPRFGLAPQPVQAGSGALNVSYGLGWWLDRDFHGLTGSAEADRNGNSHRCFILSGSPVPAGLSHLDPKSFPILLQRTGSRDLIGQGGHRGDSPYSARGESLYHSFLLDQSVQRRHYCRQRLRVFLQIKSRLLKSLPDLSAGHGGLAAFQYMEYRFRQSRRFSFCRLNFSKQNFPVRFFRKETHHALEQNSQFGNSPVILFASYDPLFKFGGSLSNYLHCVKYHNGVYYHG
jgi:hypothetical protein